MTTTSAAPSHPLTLINPPAPHGIKDTPPTRFLLFGRDWLDLQSFIAQALKLPTSTENFKKTYGDFSDQKEIEGVATSMKQVQELSAKFGDPTMIKDKIIHDGAYLTSTTPPSELYGHIVWLAIQVENTAQSFAYTFANLKDLLSPSAGTPEERAQNLKAILTGEGGLVSQAEDMKKKTQTLMSSMASFDKDLNAATTGLARYTGDSSQILADANEIIKDLNDELNGTKGHPGLISQADEAYKEWRDFTIAAVSASVGIMIISVGTLWPIAAAVGGGLGAKAATEMALYNKLTKSIKKDKEKLKKKTQLVTDLKSLDNLILGTPDSDGHRGPSISNSLTDFQSKLSQIEGVWLDVSGSLQYVSTNYGVEQLSSLPWVSQALKIGDAQHKWKAIGTTAQQFTSNSLVNYVSTTQFGDEIVA